MNQMSLAKRNEQVVSLSARDFVAIAFRRRRVGGVTFAGIFLGAVLSALFLPRNYEAEMKVLVSHDRADSIVTSSANAPIPMMRTDVTEEDLNTEVQLMKSRDLLEKVVTTCGLDKNQGWLQRLLHTSLDVNSKFQVAVNKLDRELTATPVKKSNIVQITYQSSDPQLAQRVLQTVSDLYLQKHVAVHRPPGTAEFFDKQADQFGRELLEAEARLAQFSQSQGVVVAQTERENALQKANEFEALLRQAESSVRELQKRVNALQRQITASPARIVTADQNEDAQLITQLRSQLATLELKRTELLGRFEPGYRPLKDIEAQMAELGREIKADEQTPVRKITTDNNPTALLVSGELAKAKADLASATARSIALQRTVERYRNSAFELRDREFQEQDLVRVAKAKEQAYLLYLNKRDEARISDALDSKHIVNVALAEAPTVPYFALHSRRWILLVGLCAAVLLSTIAVIGSEMTDHRLYTPREIEACLELPVLAALPRADQLVEGRSA